jgi:hypothetical protein
MTSKALVRPPSIVSRVSSECSLVQQVRETTNDDTTPTHILIRVLESDHRKNVVKTTLQQRTFGFQMDDHTFSKLCWIGMLLVLLVLAPDVDAATLIILLHRALVALIFSLTALKNAMSVRKGFKHLYYSLGCFAVLNLAAQLRFIVASQQLDIDIEERRTAFATDRLGYFVLIPSGLCLGFVFIVKLKNMAYVLGLGRKLVNTMKCMKISLALVVLAQFCSSVLPLFTPSDSRIRLVGTACTLSAAAMFVASIVWANHLMNVEVEYLKKLLVDFVDERDSLGLVTCAVSSMMWASIFIFIVAVLTPVGNARGLFSFRWGFFALVFFSQLAFSQSMVFAFRALRNFATDQRVAKINVARKSVMRFNSSVFATDFK